MIFSRRIKRHDLYRIVPAPAAIAGRGRMVRQRSGRFDWTVQVGYPPPLTESGVRIASFLVALRGTSGSCQDIAECGMCMSHTTPGVLDCCFCSDDLECHAVESAVSPCTPAMADDQCFSLTSLSDRSIKDADMCATMTGHEVNQLHIAVAGRTDMRVMWKTVAAATYNASTLRGSLA